MILLEKSTILYLIIKIYLNIPRFFYSNFNSSSTTQFISDMFSYPKSTIISLYILLIGSLPVGIVFLWLIYHSRKKNKNRNLKKGFSRLPI